MSLAVTDPSQMANVESVCTDCCGNTGGWDIVMCHLRMLWSVVGHTYGEDPMRLITDVIAVLVYGQ